MVATSATSQVRREAVSRCNYCLWRMPAKRKSLDVTRVRALLVDDHASFGESVSRALSAQPDLEVSFCTTITSALEILQRQPVDIVLLDHDLGVERASQFLPVARERDFAGRVLIVTAWVSDTEAKRLLRQGV